MNQNELREYLFQKDLAQQKEMDKLIKDAQPKKVNDNYKLKLYKPPIITRDLIGPEYTAEKQLMDLSLDLQLQNMVKQAMYAVDGKTPEPMKGSVTEEMIADYKKEVMKPVQIGGQYHLYRPVEIPPLVKPRDKPYDHGGAKITQATYERRRQYILDNIAAYQEDLTRQQAYRKTLADRFSFTSSSVYDEAAERAALNALSRDEIVTRAGYRTSKQDTAALINRIINKEKLGKPKAVDLTSIKDEIDIVDDDIRSIIKEI